MMVIAKKRFGQHFLTDPGKAEKLVRMLEPVKGETVMEIGPGTGILTEKLLGYGVHVVAVEIDRDLVPALLERFGSNELFRLVEDDIVNVDPSALACSNFKVMGNLPYNISGAVVEWLVEIRGHVGLAVITVQKEVADRLRAAPGTRAYGAMSVLAQSFFDITKLFDIPPGCFTPRPKVISTALRFLPEAKLPDHIPYKEFREFVRGCFSQKRKKLANSLVTAFGIDKNDMEEKLAALGLSPDVRAEQLELSRFYDLYESMA